MDLMEEKSTRKRGNYLERVGLRNLVKEES
jgi:hypothetical protein